MLVEGLSRSYDNDEDTEDQKDQASAVEQIVSSQEQEQHRASLAELIAARQQQQQQQEQALLRPRGFLGGEMRTSLDDSDEEDDDQEDESVEPESTDQAAETFQEVDSIDRPVESEAADPVHDIVSEGTLGATIEQPQGQADSNLAQSFEIQNENPAEQHQAQRLESSLGAAQGQENKVPELSAVDNTNKAEFVNQNDSIRPPVNHSESADNFVTDPDEEAPENTVPKPTNTSNGSTGNGSRAGSGTSISGSGTHSPKSSPSSLTPSHAYTPPPPPRPGGRSYHHGGLPPPSPGNTWTAPAAVAGSVLPSAAAANLVRTIERPHTHPGIIAALLVSHLIGVHRANQLRRDAERTRDDFNKRMTEMSDRMSMQETETRKAQMREAQQKELIENQQQGQVQPVETNRLQTAQDSSEVERYITQVQQHEQIIKNKEIARREAEKLSRLRNRTLGSRPKPGTEHHLGPVEAALANPNIDNGPPLESEPTRWDSLNRPYEVQAEPASDRVNELRRERMRSADRDAATGSGKAVRESAQSIPSDLPPSSLLTGGIVGDDSHFEQRAVEGAPGTKDYSKAISSGFVAGIVVLTIALVVYFIMR